VTPGARLRRAVLPAAALLLLAAAWLSPRVVPYDMDEFVAYHPLGCALHPLSRLNVFRERCGEYDLTPPLLGVRLPLRSYLYIGSLPVVPYTPFYLLFRDPVSARVQGMVFLLLSVLLGARLFRMAIAPVAAAFALFPVLPAAFVVDTGPVGLSIVLLLTALLALRRGLEGPRGGAFLGALAGLLLFLGIFVKLVFFWCLPGVLILAACWAFASPREGRLARAGATLSALLVVLGLLAAFLLLSRTTTGARYIDVLGRAGMSTDPDEVGSVASSLALYVGDASLVLPRILSFPKSALDLLPGLAAAAILAFGLRTREGAALLLASVATFLVTDLSTRATEAHHAAYFLVFLVLGLARALSRRPGILGATLVAALVVWGSLALRLSRAEVDPRRSFEKDALLAEIRAEGLDARTVSLHASWGTYYIAHLFGSGEKAELFSRKFLTDRALVRQAAGDAESLGRTVLLVTRKPEKLGEVEAVLGPPEKILKEGSWWGVLFGGTRPSTGRGAAPDREGVP
jgi:hypothetical protein